MFFACGIDKDYSTDQAAMTGHSQPGKMLCYVLHGKADLRCEQREIPAPKPDEALIRMRRVGICGSDIHYYEDGRVGNFVLKQPFVLGHEGSGEIVATGSPFADLPPGTRVAIDPSRPCYQCKWCLSGHYNLCPWMRYLGSASVDPHVDGVFCEYFIMPARNCHPLPDGMGYGAAAMIEPLSVAMHAVQQAGSVSVSSVLITGCGTIGQLILSVAQAFGAGKVAVSETIDQRRALAGLHGADITWDPEESSIREKAMDFSGGGFDVAIESSGSPAAAKQVIDLTRRGGTVVLVGSLPPEVTLPMNSVMTKELSLNGSFRFVNAFEDAIRLAASGRIDLDRLITGTLPFRRLRDAIELASSREASLKVQVEI